MELLYKAIYSLIGVVSTSQILENAMNNPDIDTIRPIDTVSIIVPSFNEERYIEKSLLSIMEQSIIQEFPEYFELIVIDSGSTDETIPIVEVLQSKGLFDTIHFNFIKTLKRGKLTARNMATDQSKGNIIVAYDSDAYYHPLSLNTLLKTFRDISNYPIAAVHGSNIDHNIPFWPFFPIAHYISTKLSPTTMNGGNSAYWKHLFYMTGMFDSSIDQMNNSIIQKEEEQEFGKRLSKLGKIIYKINAPKLHLGGDKVKCRRGFGNKDICDQYKIGIERFG